MALRHNGNVREIVGKSYYPLCGCAAPKSPFWYVPAPNTHIFLLVRAPKTPLYWDVPPPNTPTFFGCART